MTRAYLPAGARFSYAAHSISTARMHAKGKLVWESCSLGMVKAMVDVNEFVTNERHFSAVLVLFKPVLRHTLAP